MLRRRPVLLLLLMLCFGLVVESCIHDSLDHHDLVGEQIYDIHPFSANRRLTANSGSLTAQVSTATFQPIRITPYYDNLTLTLLSNSTVAQVFSVVDEAIRRIRRALQVVPVSGNLYAHRFCTSYFSSLHTCHSIDSNEMCLEMSMPDAHFGSLRYCARCSLTSCTGCTTSPKGTGIPDTDFLIYVRAENTTNCQGRTLAYASACERDQYDRPTFAMVNFCPGQLSTSPADFERQVSVALHEFSHGLGFSSRYFPLMRTEDGTPRTPRDQTGQPPVLTKGTCPNGNAIDYYVQPSNDTVQFTTERDHVVAKMVTPRVRAFAQQHFNCSSLAGAEIESQDGGCLGSHWEERLFEPEYMSPVESFVNVFSGLTLAFFEDSGWYRVNYSTAETMQFGRLKGCKFATDKCVDPATQVPVDADTYCTSNVERCSVDGTSRSYCTLVSNVGQSIPPEYQYFPGYPSKGGREEFADFCPINVGYSSGSCSITGNRIKLGSTDINALGETYCPDCKCTPTTLRSGDSKGWNIFNRQTGCYAMRCVQMTNPTDAFLVELIIPRSQSHDSVTVNCTAKGKKLSVPGFTGDITCPDPLVVCNVAESVASAPTEGSSSGKFHDGSAGSGWNGGLAGSTGHDGSTRGATGHAGSSTNHTGSAGHDGNSRGNAGSTGHVGHAGSNGSTVGNAGHDGSTGKSRHEGNARGSVGNSGHAGSAGHTGTRGSSAGNKPTVTTGATTSSAIDRCAAPLALVSLAWIAIIAMVL